MSNDDEGDKECNHQGQVTHREWTKVTNSHSDLIDSK